MVERIAAPRVPFIARMNIKVRLTLCFAVLICFMLIGNGLLLWQSHVMQTQANHMRAIDEQFIQILLAHDSLLSFDKQFNELAETRNVARVQSETPIIRVQLEENLKRTVTLFTTLPTDEVLNPTVLPTLEAIQGQLPTELDALTSLGAAGDWDAVQWRAKQQFEPLERVSSRLVNAVQMDASTKQREATAILTQAQTRAAYILGGAAAISLLVAAWLGVVVTRSITAPLGSLVDGSHAVARGDFQHRVPITGRDELAHLAGVFNETSARLEDLYKELQVLSDARLSERTRIAQELHDTLLQGVLSASMQLTVADDLLPVNSPAKPLVRRIIELMGIVADEGRNAVQGLRLSKDLEDFEQAFSRIPQQLGLAGTADFRVIVEGSSRGLRPRIRDEVYRIGREALMNAFRHSGAKNIEVALVYSTDELRVSVRDDGSGIDPQVLRQGRAGHWGLLGMRERAEKIGAKLKVLSSQTNGTEVELRVPVRIAFESQPSNSSVTETFTN